VSDTFTRDRDGTNWRFHSKCIASARDQCIIIEPIPAPPQTEAEILAEMGRVINACDDVFTYERRQALQKVARAIVAACKKIGEAGK
jgi:hypothetical protein